MYDLWVEMDVGVQETLHNQLSCGVRIRMRPHVPQIDCDATKNRKGGA